MARTVNPQHTQALMDLLTQAPYFSLLGMRFEAMEPGYCRLTLPLSYARHGNAFGSIHGGAYSSLIDTAAYWAAYCDMDEDQGYTSLDLSVTNLGMARAGTLVAEGRVIRAGPVHLFGGGHSNHRRGKTPGPRHFQADATGGEAVHPRPAGRRGGPRPVPQISLTSRFFQKRRLFMHDELTQVDIDKMKEELQHRIQVLRPQLIEEVKVARSFGDLSENFEYKAAKREKNRNDSRIRYLQNMIKTAVVIDGTSQGEGIALFDKVTFLVEDDGTQETIQLVTTLRQDALKGLISKESPVGKALLGHKVGDRVKIQVSDTFAYYVQIQQVEKTGEDPDLPISTF